MLYPYFGHPTKSDIGPSLHRYASFYLGFAPWRICVRQVSQRRGKHLQRWCECQIEAAFWQVRVERQPQGLTWQVTLPLIARLKAAIWSALRDLIKG